MLSHDKIEGWVDIKGGDGNIINACKTRISKATLVISLLSNWINQECSRNNLVRKEVILVLVIYSSSYVQVYDSAGKYLFLVGSGYLWLPMVLLSEIVQTFILADFCYYYIKRWALSVSIFDELFLCFQLHSHSNYSITNILVFVNVFSLRLLICSVVNVQLLISLPPV